MPRVTDFFVAGVHFQRTRHAAAHRCRGGSQTLISDPRFTGAFCLHSATERLVYMVYSMSRTSTALILKCDRFGHLWHTALFEAVMAFRRFLSLGTRLRKANGRDSRNGSQDES